MYPIYQHQREKCLYKLCNSQNWIQPSISTELRLLDNVIQQPNTEAIF